MPRSLEVKEWPGLWAVRGGETGGSAFHPVVANFWVSLIANNEQYEDMKAWPLPYHYHYLLFNPPLKFLR